MFEGSVVRGAAVEGAGDSVCVSGMADDGVRNSYSFSDVGMDSSPTRLRFVPLRSVPEDALEFVLALVIGQLPWFVLGGGERWGWWHVGCVLL